MTEEYRKEVETWAVAHYEIYEVTLRIFIERGMDLMEARRLSALMTQASAVASTLINVLRPILTEKNK